jgi:hypothetical protein
MTLSTVRREAVELLCAAQADGRISVDLFESRLAAVQQATTDSSVLAIVADLIEETPHRGVSAYEPPLPAVPFAERLRLSAVLGSTRREGNWVVPYRLELMALMGEGHFDFRDAILPDDLIDVHVSVTLASMVLVVPKGTYVEHSGVEAILGSTEVKRKGKAYVPPNGLTLRVTGNLLLGSLESQEK